MNLDEYIEKNGEYIGANMWEISFEKSNDLIHLAKSSRPNTPPRFFLNGNLSDKNIISELLTQNSN